ncbi:RING finger protein Etp1p [Monosporozyma unispora]|nr:hypothetical protein C6P44_004167 [Kazachstania unispora]
MNSVYSLVIHLESDTVARQSYKIFKHGIKNVSTNNNSLEQDTAHNSSKDERIHKYSIITGMHGDKDKVISEYLGHGCIRLFKERDIETNPDDCSANLIVPGDDTMICILFVPTYFTVHDLLHFYIGDDIVNNQITNFRILQNRDAGVGFNFMVLMKFKDPRNAKYFQETFNGKKFSKIDPECCHVVFIKEVVFKPNLFENDDKSLPYLLTDPFTRLDKETHPVELPMCPVCLERMDSETSGLITIPCQHTFHCHCLDAWKNSKCPVCRYSSFRLARDSLIKQAGNSPKCTTCGVQDNLWICLICGNIGCGRYNSKHAIQHYDSTSHCFAMDIKTQRVWDYAGDNYVHRIVQNEVDGKLVEVSGNVGNNPSEEGSSQQHSQNNNNSNGDSDGKPTNDKDLDLAENFLRNKEYHLEYVQVLVSQLESQREYYEEKIALLQKGVVAQEQLQTITRRMDLIEEQSDKRMKLYNERAKTIQELTEANKKQKELLEEKDRMLDGMSANLATFNKKLEKQQDRVKMLTEERKNLEEQVQDLMFYFKARDQFEGATEEEINGTVVMPASTADTTTSKSNKKKKKKKKKVPAIPPPQIAK